MKHNPVTSTDLLLFDILQTLKHIEQNTSRKKICSVCGKPHDNPWEYAQCANKKKEVQKEVRKE